LPYCISKAIQHCTYTDVFAFLFREFTSEEFSAVEIYRDVCTKKLRYNFIDNWAVKKYMSEGLQRSLQK